MQAMDCVGQEAHPIECACCLGGGGTDMPIEQKLCIEGNSSPLDFNWELVGHGHGHGHGTMVGHYTARPNPVRLHTHEEDGGFNGNRLHRLGRKRAGRVRQV